MHNLSKRMYNDDNVAATFVYTCYNSSIFIYTPNWLLRVWKSKETNLLQVVFDQKTHTQTLVVLDKNSRAQTFGWVMATVKDNEKEMKPTNVRNNLLLFKVLKEKGVKTNDSHFILWMKIKIFFTLNREELTKNWNFKVKF